MPSGLLWRLYLSYLAITILSLIAVLIISVRSVRTFYHDRVREELEIRAQLVESDVLARMDNRSDLDGFIKRMGRSTATRFTVVLPDGLVIADSDEDPAKMENHGDRPEIKAALAGEPGSSDRFSHTLRREMVYLGVPLMSNGKVAGVLRASMPLTSIGAALREVQGFIFVGAVVVALAMAGMSLLVSRQLSRPLVEMKDVAERFAAGELHLRAPLAATRELAQLGRAMNEMAAQLSERIAAMGREQHEREAILASMAEGVIAIGSDQKVIIINESAARMLDADGSDVVGRSLGEVARVPELQQAVERALAAGRLVETEFRAPAGGGRDLQTHIAVVRDPDRGAIGAVIVMSDITRIRKLESGRKDFVANVSHELKTPITSIKGFIETLMEGAVDQREDAERFLGIMARQADQLNALIDDLLLLSRLEQDEVGGGLEFHSLNLRPVLVSAMELCAARADEKEVLLELECPELLRARVNPALVRQALVNLISNAVMYSNAGSRVAVRGRTEEGRVVLEVEDHGVGIAAEHLSRIFERFYRVDKARSRKQGGTGLGLAIVKHIMLAHGGKVGVKSEPGRGSIFTLDLPPNNDEHD